LTPVAGGVTVRRFLIPVRKADLRMGLAVPHL
jgi:hypothetical protein